MPDWQLISTTRKMLGDTVDLWVVDKTITPNGSVNARGRRVANAVWSHNTGTSRHGWVANNEPVEGAIPHGRTVATHWRPLPDAPDESEETKG